MQNFKYHICIKIKFIELQKQFSEKELRSNHIGFLEFLPNTISLDAMKKYLKSKKYKSLREFCKIYFGEDFHFAQINLIKSLTGYSLLTYIMQIQDRHNGNILIDNQGDLIHTDFGFMISQFKTTQDYIELMDGCDQSFATLLQILELMMEKSNFHSFTFLILTNFKINLNCRKPMKKYSKIFIISAKIMQSN
ncbi:unnamed protein product [Paramecium sonneborni]|uniref:PI3K/PI4K catalytic domain-containing protein n=1 Tax=Paramecium sonneborni TaxID=65129 RepID=A0A8S1LT15_9CILI|nr:unnamed protein product [Paramecium sonneborni]